MEKSIIKRLEIGTRMSEVAVHNGTVYLAGQVAANGNEDIRSQTEQVLAAVDALLAQVGSDKKVLRPQLVGFANFDEMVTTMPPVDA